QRTGCHHTKVVAVTDADMIAAAGRHREINRSHAVHLHDIAVSLYQRRTSLEDVFRISAVAQFEENPVHDCIIARIVQYRKIKNYFTAALAVLLEKQTSIWFCSGQEAFDAQIIFHQAGCSVERPLQE